MTCPSSGGAATPPSIDVQAKKRMCVKVTRPETHGSDFCMWWWEQFDAHAEMDGGEIGDKVTLELCEMTQEEFDELGTFDGW